MRDYCDENSDMPDGAFFALAEETYGWTVDDWVWLAEVGGEIQKLLDKKKNNDKNN